VLGNIHPLTADGDSQGEGPRFRPLLFESSCHLFNTAGFFQQADCITATIEMSHIAESIRVISQGLPVCSPGGFLLH
jgi:hypothetical protein